MLRVLLSAAACLSLALACRERPTGAPAAPDAGRLVGLPSATPAPPPPPTGAPAAGGGLDACGLLSGDELGRITGVGFGDGVVTVSQPDVGQCAFPRKPRGEHAMMLSVHRGNADQVWATYAASADLAPADGVGDQALWSADRKVLHVRAGDVVLIVSFEFPEAKREAAVEIARRALQRL